MKFVARNTWAILHSKAAHWKQNRKYAESASAWRVCVSACWVSHVRTLWIYSVHYFHINKHIYTSTGCNGKWCYSLNFTAQNRSKVFCLKCLSFVQFLDILINLIGIFFETILFGYFYKTCVSLKLLYKNTFRSRAY